MHATYIRTIYSMLERPADRVILALPCFNWPDSLYPNDCLQALHKRALKYCVCNLYVCIFSPSRFFPPSLFSILSFSSSFLLPPSQVLSKWSANALPTAATMEYCHTTRLLLFCSSGFRYAWHFQFIDKAKSKTALFFCSFAQQRKSNPHTRIDQPSKGNTNAGWLACEKNSGSCFFNSFLLLFSLCFGIRSFRFSTDEVIAATVLCRHSSL